MILAAGLSPAWQQIVVLDELRSGEVNRAREVLWCASGKVINVGMALHHLCEPREGIASTNVSCRMLTVRGGTAGESLEQELATRGLSRRWVSTSASTRVCTTLLELPREVALGSPPQRTTTEIVENARSISEAELDAFITAFTEEAARAKVVVLTGSLPAGVPADLFATLLNRSTCPVIVDVQGPPLLAACAARPFLVKPNREELGRTLARILTSEGDVWQAMQELQRAGTQAVLVTEGAGRVRLCIGEKRFQFTSMPVSVVNPIGCGDCLAAGVAWGLSTGLELPSAVKIGIAAAAENAEQLLPARLNRDSVLRRAAQITVEECR